MGSLITALAAIGALVFTSQSLRANQKQIELSEQGQLTERFGKAVEQLGSNKLDVQLGGIYALERLARDSARDHPTVMEVLAAFVRTHAPATACSATPETPNGPTADVQAALTVVGRDAAHAQLSERLNLTDTCLTRAVIIGNLTGANFFAADLSRASLRGADLSGASLYGADLIFADLGFADLTHTVLERADLTNAFLNDADLTGANLIRAFLNDANLGRANLSYANLEGDDLSGADLTGANLTGANLTEANLNRANLAGANLTEANLAGATLAGATLAEANLTGAILTEANLTGANLTDVTGVPAPPSVPPTSGPTR
jgi:uncharacterized protein YjbI with pentapeptide repeats